MNDLSSDFCQDMFAFIMFSLGYSFIVIPHLVRFIMV